MKATSNHQKRVIAGALLALISFSFVSQTVMADEESDFRDAAAFFRGQRWQYAADEFEQFLEQHPRSARIPLARLYLGLCQNSLEQYAESRDNLQQFLNASPENRNAADARYRIGECSYYLKDYDATIKQLGDYLEKHDGHQLNSWGRLLLGESLNQKKRFREAQEALAVVLPIAEKDGILDDAEFAIAVALQGQDKTEEARAKFQQLLDRKSARFEHRALARLGALAFDARDYATASRFYDQLVQDHARKPGTPTAALQSGIAKFQLQDYEESLVRFEKIPEDTTAFEYGQLWKGLALSRLGKTEEARTVLQDAYGKVTDPTLSAELLFRRAELEMMDRRIPEAIAMFKDLADRWPKSEYVASSLFNIADLQLEQGNVSEAEAAMQRLLEVDPKRADQPDVWTVQGRLRLQKDEVPDAISLLEKAVADTEATPDQILIRTYHLVRAFHQAEQHADVVKTVAPLVDDIQQRKRTEVASMLSLAAISSLALNQKAQAIDYANRYIAISPDVKSQADALSARSIAASREGDLESARSDLLLLIENFNQLPATWIAVLQCAESAWAKERYAEAAEFFDLATAKNQAARIRVMALSGGGWSYFRLNEVNLAMDRLQTLIQDYPEVREATEGRYLLGRILVDENQYAEAVEQFRIVFETLQKQLTDSDQKPDDVRYLFSSGRYYAQLLGRLNKAPEANLAWEKMAQLFDQSQRLDQILDEWAGLNLQTANYDKSDEIYRLLLDRFPQSPYAGQARLSLAESQMQNDQLKAAFEEFQAIVADSNYDEREQSAALYHIVDIQAARQQWTEVTQSAASFFDRYPQHERTADIQLLAADAAVNLKQYQKAESQLMALRKSLLDQQSPAADWAGRVWVLLAEVALAERRYSDVDRIATEMADVMPNSKWMFQMKFLQGRRWKSQAPPDFPRARQYLQQVTSDDKVQGTETAARSQFLIAETYLLQEDYDEAAREYHRVHLVYTVPEWQARSLFQAGRCEERLGRNADALRSYQDLIDEFPRHELATKAQERIRELES